MKNIFLRFSFVCFLLSGIHGFAQEVQLATLQSGDDMQAFYGPNALINAVAAAENGDLITLSAGVFNPTTSSAPLNKVVIIQGAGYITDVENGKYPTVINGSMYIRLQETDEGLFIEGLRFDNFYNHGTLVSCTFKKCLFRNSVILNAVGSFTKHCLFDQCKINSFSPDNASENLYLKNSIINQLGGNSTSAMLYIENCYINEVGSYAGGTLITAIFKNNIINNASRANTNSVAYNNVTMSNGFPSNVAVQSGNTNATVNMLFGKETLAAWDIDDYVLTPESQTNFLGLDGTQVGIYGGDTPFTDIPTNPQITKRKIDAKSSLDGKLKVNITVE